MKAFQGAISVLGIATAMLHSLPTAVLAQQPSDIKEPPQINTGEKMQFTFNEPWTEGPYYGDLGLGTFFADVTGDGLADAIAVNKDRVTVRRSNGSSFTLNEYWTQEPYYGEQGIIFDANLPGHLNEALAFLETPDYGTLRTFFADVTGDGKADAIVVNNDRITVRRSNGSSFTLNESWTEGPYYGTLGTFFADVTGDGKADAIVVNNDRITVRRSNGSSFTLNESWTEGLYYGTLGTFFADVTGDGKADAIVVNNDRVTVRRSNGSSFTLNESWTEGPYYGTQRTFFADVTGDGKADAIVVNDDRVTVRRSSSIINLPDGDEPVSGISAGL